MLDYITFECDRQCRLLAQKRPVRLSLLKVFDLCSGLFAEPSVRTFQLKRDMPSVSQKMLTQHLREIEIDHRIERTDFGERPPRVEYQLTHEGRGLMSVLVAARDFGAARPPAVAVMSHGRHVVMS